MGHNSEEWKRFRASDPFVDDISGHDTYTATPELQSTMRVAFALTTYEFIPPDDSLLEADGFCVVDQISKIYGPLNNRLTRDNFIAEVKAIARRENRIEDWNIEEDGVRVWTLSKILENMIYLTTPLILRVIASIASGPSVATILSWYTTQSTIICTGWVTRKRQERRRHKIRM